MGVKDLTAVIKRYCPGVIRVVNGRWKELRGSTIAIDGTLLTQRYYYGKEGLLLSYMKLLNETHRHGIKLVAVFDGDKRLSQKHRESVRREEGRVLLQTRLENEQRRWQRLDKLESAYNGSIEKEKKEKKADMEHLMDCIHELTLYTTSSTVAATPTTTNSTLSLLTPTQILLNAQERSLYLSLVDGLKKDTTETVVDESSRQPDTETEAALSTPTSTPTPIHSRIQAEIAALKLTTNESIIRYSKKPPSGATYARVKQLLNAAGVPTLTVNQDPVHEGEALASALVLNGMADYVLSEDTDVLIYGAKMIRDGGGLLRVFDGSLLQSSLGLSSRQLVDFALLSGTDFAMTIPSIGPIRALKHVKEFGSIENILQHNSYLTQLLLDKRGISVECFLHEVSQARRVYETLPAIPTSINFGAWNDEAVRQILKEEKLDMRSTWGETDNHYDQLKKWGM